MSSPADKLGKLLALTQSDNDHEALAAIRAANAILKQGNITWPQVIDAAAAHFEQTANRRPAMDVAIRDAFAYAFCTTGPGKRREFLASIHGQWERTGSLSPAQLRALFDIAERAPRPPSG